MLKKLFVFMFSIAMMMVFSLSINVQAAEKTDGLVVERSYTYAIGTHKARGSSGKCTSNGVTHVYNYSGIKYEYYNVKYTGNKAYASLRAKANSDQKYYTDSSVITF